MGKAVCGKADGGVNGQPRPGGEAGPEASWHRIEMIEMLQMLEWVAWLKSTWHGGEIEQPIPGIRKGAKQRSNSGCDARSCPYQRVSVMLARASVGWSSNLGTGVEPNSWLGVRPATRLGWRSRCREIERRPDPGHRHRPPRVCEAVEHWVPAQPVTGGPHAERRGNGCRHARYRPVSSQRAGGLRGRKRRGAEPIGRQGRPCNKTLALNAATSRAAMEPHPRQVNKPGGPSLFRATAVQIDEAGRRVCALRRTASEQC